MNHFVEMTWAISIYGNYSIYSLVRMR